MAVYRRNKTWWFRFNWRGETIRESTKQTNKRVAEQMEAARKTQLAKGEVGIRDRIPAPTLRAFAKNDFLPYVHATFAAKTKTLAYYENGMKNLLAYTSLADLQIDAITTEKIAGFVATRQERGLAVASINRELQVLRRAMALATEWGKVEKVLPRVRMLAGEQHRERVLSPKEEALYLAAAEPLLHDVSVILLDCGMRPEECFRLRWAQVTDSVLEIHYGKTDNARRRVPITARVEAVLSMRRKNGSEWVFPAPTKSGHIEPSSIKKQHLKACKGNCKDEPGKPPQWAVTPFPLYTLRHTCLTRWAPHMDPWTLAYLAGHRDMAITKRYVHPQSENILEAMKRAEQARGGHKFGHSAETEKLAEEAAGGVIH